MADAQDRIHELANEIVRKSGGRTDLARAYDQVLATAAGKALYRETVGHEGVQKSIARNAAEALEHAEAVRAAGAEPTRVAKSAGEIAAEHEFDRLIDERIAKSGGTLSRAQAEALVADSPAGFAIYNRLEVAKRDARLLAQSGAVIIKAAAPAADTRPEAAQSAQVMASATAAAQLDLLVRTRVQVTGESDGLARAEILLTPEGARLAQIASMAPPRDPRRLPDGTLVAA